MSTVALIATLDTKAEEAEFKRLTLLDRQAA